MAGARLRGKVQPRGGATTVRFFWRQVGAGSWTATPLVDAGAAAAPNEFFWTFTLGDVELDPSTNYEFYAWASNGGGTVSGDVVGFTTASPLPPPSSLPRIQDPDCPEFNPGGADGSAGRNFTDGVNWYLKFSPDKAPQSKFGPGALPGQGDRPAVTDYFGDLIMSRATTGPAGGISVAGVGGVWPFTADNPSGGTIPAGCVDSFTQFGVTYLRLKNIRIYGNLYQTNRNSTTNASDDSSLAVHDQAKHNVILVNRAYDSDWPRKIETAISRDPSSGLWKYGRVNCDDDRFEIHRSGGALSNISASGTFAKTERRYPIYYLKPVLTSDGTTTKKPTAGSYKLRLTWYSYSDTNFANPHTHTTAAIPFDAKPEDVQRAILEATNGAEVFRNRADVDGGALKTITIFGRSVQFYTDSDIGVTGHDHDQYRDDYVWNPPALTGTPGTQAYAEKLERNYAAGAKYGITFRSFNKGPSIVSMDNSFQPLAGCDAGLAITRLEVLNNTLTAGGGAIAVTMLALGAYSGNNCVPAPYAYGQGAGQGNGQGVLQRFFCERGGADGFKWAGTANAADNDITGAFHFRYGTLLTDEDRVIRFAGRGGHNDPWQTSNRVDNWNNNVRQFVDYYSGATVPAGRQNTLYAVMILGVRSFCYFQATETVSVEALGGIVAKCLLSGPTPKIRLEDSSFSGAEDCWFNQVDDPLLGYGGGGSDLVTGGTKQNLVWSGNKKDDGTNIPVPFAASSRLNGTGVRSAAQGYGNGFGTCIGV